MVLVHSIAERIKARADAAAQEAQTMAAVHEAAQRMREKVAASLLSAQGGDEQLRRTTNRGHGWERPEMANAADFFQREEVGHAPASNASAGLASRTLAGLPVYIGSR